MHETILKNYHLDKISSILKIQTGLINETYKVNTKTDVFILQKLNPIFASESILDVEAVSQYLKNKGLVVQEIIKTRENKLWVEKENEIWRLMTYIPGEVFIRAGDTNITYEAGKILGQFHYALKDFKYRFQHHREMHHATEKHLELLLPHLNPPPRRGGGEEGEIEKLKNIILEIKNLLLPKNLRRTITHGDPKISNIIFAPRSETSAAGATRSFASTNYHAIAMIDLDDVGNEHNPPTELGDAMRSWCGSHEDDPKNSFDLEKFEAAIRGYVDGSKDFLTAEEKNLLPRAIKLITLELASRFLRDYFEDSYFGWDKAKYKSRQAHNLARAKGQVALYNDIVRKEREIASLYSQ